VALVTGVTGGLGRALTQAFHAQGITVVGLSRRPEIEPGIWSADITREADVGRVFGRLATEFGRLDILVNCAAIVSHADDLAVSGEEWERVFAVNVFGSYSCCRHAIELMRPAGYGRIVNVSSIAGRFRSRSASVAYTSSKHAVIGLTRHLAATAGPFGITVNCVAPSQFESPMLVGMSEEQRRALISNIPVGRFGRADEVASAITYLASPAASYVNGAIIDVNGGAL
jgi:3-oxoacyl-[acyl-carrier protein] reductase